MGYMRHRLNRLARAAGDLERRLSQERSLFEKRAQEEAELARRIEADPKARRACEELGRCMEQIRRRQAEAKLAGVYGGDPTACVRNEPEPVRY